jgi:membrane-associated phospholipid phosphatase
MFYGWLFYEDSFPDGHIAVYFILFGLLSLLFIVITMRNRVDRLREEIINIIES